tara:strand:+ start:1729 stop:2127 length:399 start_codon:yes stop_codon:yes gene_type:complete
MAMEKLCPPAAIFLVFMIIQISIDSAKGYLNSALMKVWVGILLTILLNYLCSSGLGIVSWLFIFIPFVLMTVIITVLLFMFGLDPKTGRVQVKNATDDGKEFIDKEIRLTGTDSKGNMVRPTTINIRSETKK